MIGHHRQGTRAFCAGGDMGGLQTLSADTVGSPKQTDFSALVAERHPYFLTQLTKPVIAAMNGSVAGIGLAQALMTDIRFAAVGAKFATSYARRDLVAEYGVSWILPRLVGWTVAVELLLSGRTFLAEEAAELGADHRRVPGRRVDGSRDRLRRGHRAQFSTSSLAMMKRQLYADAGMGMVETGEQGRETHARVDATSPTSSKVLPRSSKSVRRIFRHWSPRVSESRRMVGTGSLRS